MCPPLYAPGGHWVESRAPVFGIHFAQVWTLGRSSLILEGASADELRATCISLEQRLKGAACSVTWSP